MKILKSILLITFFALTFSHSVNGQTSPKRISIRTSVFFDGQSETVQIKLPALPNGNLDIRLDSRVKQGELTVELYDPKGERQGNFTIGSPTFSSDVMVSGDYSKRIVAVEKGEWIVKFIPNNASGTIEISFYQKFN